MLSRIPTSAPPGPSLFRMPTYLYPDPDTALIAGETDIVATYPDHDAAEQAVSKLRDASFDVTKLSIIGRLPHG